MFDVFVYFRIVICFQLLVRLYLVLFSVNPMLPQMFCLMNPTGHAERSPFCSPGDHLNANKSFIQKHLELLKRYGEHLSLGEGHVKP
jgi:hypothetical protein